MARAHYPPNHWSAQTCEAEAQKYKTRTEFRLNAKGAYTAAKKLGILDLVCQHMELGHLPANYWSFERCFDEARKYRTRVSFQKGSEAAYSKSRKSGWLDEICCHMKPSLRNGSFWTRDRCEDEALKYNTRTAFSKGSPRAYQIALDNGWIDQICWFMDRCARDTVYMIRESKPEGMKFLVKFGVTTSGSNNYRIEMGKRHFVEAVVDVVKQVSCPSSVERMLLRRYTDKPSESKKWIDGHTELRLLTHEEVVEAIGMVQNAK